MHSMIRYARLLLLPISLIYGIIVFIRNKFYDWGVFRSTRFDLPVICVGNLVVGGSGKTPVTEYLVQLLSGYKIAILSRGYGRETKGFLFADEDATARTVGDEPLQFYHKFPDVTVAVCEDRVKGINVLKSNHDLIILDDAYQHRAVQPGFSILLFEFNKLLKRQFLLPAGNMREAFYGIVRSDMILVTKSPAMIPPNEKQKILSKFDHTGNIFFSSINYGQLTSLYSRDQISLDYLKGKTVFLISGIANPLPLLEKIKVYTDKVIHHDFPDHHGYSIKDLENIKEAFKRDPSKEKIIVTTEKDAQRLFDDTFKEILLNLPVFYLPIKIIIEAEYNNAFNQKILKYVSDTSRNR